MGKNFKTRLFIGGTEQQVIRVVSGPMTEWQVAGRPSALVVFLGL
ncbi:MAG: hypothetical protein ACE5JD_06620 [Candidatus Methylomirabilia bacterium]